MTQLTLPFPHLKFSPSILRRLGEELNPSPDHGLLELIKNSYDADARTCRVQLTDVSDVGGKVVITDDGVGMTYHDIDNRWMVLGHSTKSTDQLTGLGRIPVGNKGLGRLAALRLGNVITVESRPASEPKQVHSVTIDWRKVDAAEVVEQVELPITSRDRLDAETQGTTITISDLKVRLSRNDAKKLARGILILADPFAADPVGFQPSLKAKEFRDLEELVQKRYFNDAEFHLTARVDAEGVGSAVVTDWQGNTIFEGDHNELRKKSASTKYSCPAMQFDLWAFVLDAAVFSTRAATIAEVRDWLNEFGGVHLYIHGFRVAPYGNAGNDWLDMNLSRARSPELRPSTNTSIGRIAVDDPGEDLRQKTDRTGLIENSSFEQMKLFATEALNWMAKRRLDERDRRRQHDRVESSTRAKKTKQSVVDAIEGLPESAQEQFRDAFEKHERARDKETKALRKEVQLYRTLSTAGITAAVFAHESRTPLKVIERTAKQIRTKGKKALGNEYETSIERPVDRIMRQAEALKAFGNLTLSQVDHDKRRARRVELHAVLKNVCKMFSRFLDQRDVSVQLILDHGSPYLRTSESAIESIATNLLTNSLQAFESSPPGQHKVVFQTGVQDDLFTLTCRDNGPGLQDIKPRDVWLPGESTYPNGTGLGLTIVRDTIVDLGGAVEAVSPGELGGAEFNIQIPILGV